MITGNDFKRQWADTGKDVLRAVERVGGSGWYVLGSEVEGFEEELASCWGLHHAAGVATGMDAIEISLRILGCRPRDRVLTTPLSAFATTLAIVKLGAIPVFVDTDEHGLIDMTRCHDLLRHRSDIPFFVPVHLYGHALDGGGLTWLRDQFDLKIVEDCAQSAGASWNGLPTGSVGQLAATSFYPTKNLGAMGDGGAILTNDPALDAQVRVLRAYGETERYRHEVLGYNSRLDELQAAILREACLPRLRNWVRRRRAIAEAYEAGIHNNAVRLPGTPGGSLSSWHLFPVLVDPSRRADFLAHLLSTGIVAGVHYPTAIPDQPALAKESFELIDDCATARRLCASEVSLPIHPYLTNEEVSRVIQAVNGWTEAPAKLEVRAAAQARSH
ncbi:MAG: DegT/DnrJ/EryC1/StrS family aminotransferase [Acidobacteriota bacterium]